MGGSSRASTPAKAKRRRAQRFPFGKTCRFELSSQGARLCSEASGDSQAERCRACRASGSALVHFCRVLAEIKSGQALWHQLEEGWLGCNEAPLEECSTLDAWLASAISSRCCNLFPQVRMRHSAVMPGVLGICWHQDSLGAKLLLSSQRSAANGRIAPATEENLHRVALQISGRLSSHRLAFAALVAAVSGRCASMLRRGWCLSEVGRS